MVRFTAAITFLATIAASADAFTMPGMARAGVLSTRSVAPSTTARNILLTEEETAAIFDKATNCAEGECSIDEVDELIVELKEQQKLLDERLTVVMNMITDLQHVNEKDSRKPDEVRQYVRDFLRVFTHDEPMFSPSGFSGDIGDGPKTAYDALPPKPYKPKKDEK